MFWISVAVLALCCVAPVISVCMEGEFNLNGQQCCTMCPAGSGVKRQCTVGNNTACDVCVSGVNFSSNRSHTEQCQNCSKCPQHSHIKVVCNITQDTICECDTDTYIHPETGECRKCDKCGAGWEVKVSCIGTQNTICDVCPNGTFSREKSSTVRCLPCTVCRDDQKMLQTCSSSQDTICLSVPIYSTNPEGKYYFPDSESPVQKEHKEQDNEIDIIPLYCAILGAVVVGLLGYVILVHYRRMKEKRLVREPHEDVEYSKASGGDSGIYVEVEHQQKGTNCAIVTSSTKIRDLPLSKKRELERCFSQSTNQTELNKLAKEIGFSGKKISGLENKTKPQDSSIPIRHMIQEWSNNDTVTVGVLLQALRKIGRLDVLQNIHIADSSELQPLNNPQQFVL